METLEKAAKYLENQVKGDSEYIKCFIRQNLLL